MWQRLEVLAGFAGLPAPRVRAVGLEELEEDPEDDSELEAEEELELWEGDVLEGEEGSLEEEAAGSEEEDDLGWWKVELAEEGWSVELDLERVPEDEALVWAGLADAVAVAFEPSVPRDLVALFLGFGIFGAAASHRYSAEGYIIGYQAFTRWEHVHHGDLTPRGFAFGLAVCSALAEDPKSLRKAQRAVLAPNQRSWLVHACRYVDAELSDLRTRLSLSEAPGEVLRPKRRIPLADPRKLRPPPEVQAFDARWGALSLGELEGAGALGFVEEDPASGEGSASAGEGSGAGRALGGALILAFGAVSSGIIGHPEPFFVATAACGVGAWLGARKRGEPES